jgi:hypothetical protein
LEEFHAERISLSTATKQDPPKLTFEGKFHGRAVLLHVYLEPPEKVDATEIIDLTGPGDAKVREKS